jgi:hypothetical protein
MPVLFMINPITNIGASAEGAEIITFSTTFNVLSCSFDSSKETSTLSNYININFIPFQISRVSLR